jgi:hypothetical protein
MATLVEIKYGIPPAFVVIFWLHIPSYFH